MRLFAAHIRKGDYLDPRRDAALPDRKPLPRPDIRLLQRPVGPVAVFGASNFPLAFSTAGGDTASALAAGCPVVVKGHSAHPGTGEIVAQAVDAAVKACGIHPGVFSLIQGGKRDVGESLVQHPLITAVGFTGSLAGGRALFDLCARRPNPIPFFGELGSVNPMFLLPQALAARGAQIAAGWSGSLTQGAGQFCTNPGIAVVIDGPEAQAFIDAAKEAVGQVGAQTMLTAGIHGAYRSGVETMAATPGVQRVAEGQTASTLHNAAQAALFITDARTLMEQPALSSEVFGPASLVVRAKDADELIAVAEQLEGQLTATLHLEDADHPLARRLLPVLERRAGRLLVNGFPTGVEVCHAMVHGGPYPSTSNAMFTSVGASAIDRFLRPVCYQDLPDALLPEALQQANPLGLWRLVDGAPVRA